MENFPLVGAVVSVLGALVAIAGLLARTRVDRYVIKQASADTFEKWERISSKQRDDIVAIWVRLAEIERENLRLKNELSRLEAENAWLRDRAQTLESQYSEAIKRLAAVEEENADLRRRINGSGVFPPHK